MRGPNSSIEAGKRGEPASSPLCSPQAPQGLMVPPTLGRALSFTVSTDSNANLI